MKRFLTCLLALVLAMSCMLALASCGEEETSEKEDASSAAEISVSKDYVLAEGYKLFEKDGVSFAYPKGWTLTDGSNPIMMDTNGNGPFFYVHREDAYVDSNGGAGSLSIRIEVVDEPILAYAELNIEKTYLCLTLMDQFYTALDACQAKLSELEMEPTAVLTQIGKLQGIYECLKAVDINLDDETEKEYQKLENTLKFYLGTEE